MGKVTSRQPPRLYTDLPWSPDGYGGIGGTAGEESRATRTPVVFVHGNGRCALDWRSHIRRVVADGTGDDAWALTFSDPTPGHDQMAATLDDFVRRVRDQTGRAEVDVVAHSLGVTGVRWWIETAERSDWVRRFVGIAGANHGMRGATLAARAGVDFGPLGPVDFLRDDYDQLEGHPLRRLNNPKETPQGVNCYTIRGERDPLFWASPESPRLDGAVENAVVDAGHDGAKDSPRSAQLIRGWLEVE